MKPPSPKQIELMRAMWEHRKNRGFYPTVREMCEAIGVKSKAAIVAHLVALLGKGLAERSGETKARCWLLTVRGRSVVAPETAPVVQATPPGKCPTCLSDTFTPHQAWLCERLMP